MGGHSVTGKETSGGTNGRPIPGTVIYTPNVKDPKLLKKAERSVSKRQSRLEAEKRRIDAQRHEEVLRLMVTWKDEIIPRWSEFENSSRVR